MYCLLLFSWMNGMSGVRSPLSIDTIMMISFGCVLSAMTALSFMELRRIRKSLDQKGAIKKN